MRYPLFVLLAAAIPGVRAQAAPGLEAPRAVCPVVDDALIGTWRLYDIEENAFEPTGSADIWIGPDEFCLSGERMLPNSEEDSWLYVADGIIGENTDQYFFTMFFYTYCPEQDILVIADFPSPGIGMPGAAVLKRIR